MIIIMYDSPTEYDTEHVRRIYVLRMIKVHVREDEQARCIWILRMTKVHTQSQQAELIHEI